MWSSQLPTGTVSDEQLASRTFPQSTELPTVAASTAESQRLAAANAEIKRLSTENQRARAEIRRLDSRIESLESELQGQQAAKQAIVDRYERVISELETAAATAPTTQSAGAERTTGRTQTVDGGVIQRLTKWL